jgi:hypothetical protein
MGWSTHIYQAHVTLIPATVLDQSDKWSFIQLCYFLCQNVMSEIHAGMSVHV